MISEKSTLSKIAEIMNGEFSKNYTFSHFAMRYNIQKVIITLHCIQAIITKNHLYQTLGLKRNALLNYIKLFIDGEEMQRSIYNIR